MWQLNPEHQKQNGWACFDIAVGFERQRLVKFALENNHLLEFRQLLAPEIRHAAALAVVYMNSKKEEFKNNVAKIIELYGLADALIDKADKEQLEAQAYDLLESDINCDLSQFALPISMHMEQLQKILNNYMQAHEDMRIAVETCNQSLGTQEGKYLSLQELDHYFANSDNQNHPSYFAYLQARMNLFLPFERAFIDYCQDEDVCKQYIQEYYAKRGWFSFQLSFDGEYNTSMVDIVARMISKNIVIHDINNLEKILYSTKTHDLEEVHIAFNGHNHFVGMSLANQYRVSSALFKKQERSASYVPSVLKPENYSQNKRTDFLPGFAGGLYQCDVAISYMLDAIEKKMHFDIRPEVGEADKWDDIKIVYADRNSGAPTKIIYIQSKHGYTKGGFLLPANFYNKCGKAELTIGDKKLEGKTKVFTLAMYLDDWLQLKNTMNSSVFDKTEFVLFSNRSLCDQVVGFAACFEGAPLKLSSDFIEKIGVYAKESGNTLAERNQIGFRKKLFQSLLENSQYLVNSKLTTEEKENLIKCFLRQVIFKLGEKHLDDIEQDNKRRISTRYLVANADAIYYAFRFEVQKWVRDKATAMSFTDETVVKLLDKSATQYLILGQYIGITNYQLWAILVKPNIFLQRDEVKQSLITGLNLKDVKEHQLFIISGSSQSGKSFAMAQFLEQKFKDKELIPGEFLYLNANDIENFDLKVLELSALRFIVMDLNDSKPSNNLSNICIEAKNSKIKVILLIRDEYVVKFKIQHQPIVSKHLLISYLSDEEINFNIQQLNLSNTEVRIAHKKFSFANDYFLLKAVLQIPNQFCEMVLSSVYISEENSVSSSVQREIYVESKINEQRPLYSLLILLKNNNDIKLHLFNNITNIASDAIIDVLNKSDFTFVVIDLNVLIKDYKDNDDLKKIALSKLTVNEEKQDEAFNWIIKVDGAELKNISDNLRYELSKQKYIIYIINGENDSQNILSYQIQQIDQNDALILVSQNHDQLKLPKPVTYIDSEQSTQITTITKNIKREPQQIVIVAPAGAGKSTFTKKVQEIWLKNELCGQIAWVCRIRLSKLRKKDNQKTLEKLVIERIEEKLLNWQVQYIKCAVNKYQMILILDGWDEVKEQQQVDCQEVLAKLFKYPNIIITTRPNAFSSIPLLYFNYIKLLSFDLPEIRQYVENFFGNSKFSKLILEYLGQPQTKQLLDLIGVPMQCFLLCRALEPYYDQWLNNTKFSMPWYEQPLTKSRLYQLFISASLQEYLTKHEGMHTVSPKKAFNRCKKELKCLQENALAQLFDIDNKFSYERELDNAISYFGFIDPMTSPAEFSFYNFKHQTYVEYFAAVNLVANLVSENSKKRAFAINIILNKRYIPRYRLVWQFMAGIVSYGDLQLNKMPSINDIELFWTALCMEPVELIGIVHNALIKDCLQNSNWEKVKKTKYGEFLTELYNEINTSTSMPNVVKSSVGELSIVDNKLYENYLPFWSSQDSKQTTTEIMKNLTKFLDENKEGIFSYKKHVISQIPIKISKYVKAAQIEKKEKSLINYLLNTINEKYPFKSAIIGSAIIKAIQEINICDEQVESFLIRQLSNSPNILKLLAAQTLIKFGRPINNDIFNALSAASGDHYHGDFTRIAREALIEIAKIKIANVSDKLFPIMFSSLKNASPQLTAAIFGSLSEILKMEEKRKEFVSYSEKALNKIIKNKQLNFIGEIPILLEQTEDKQLTNRVINFLIAQTPSYKILVSIRELLYKKLIKITDVKECLVDAFYNKDLTVRAIQIFIDYEAVDDSVIGRLLSIEQSGYWLVDGGLPAVACLSDYFNENISDFLIKTIQKELDQYGVLSAMVACCKKISEDLPSLSNNLIRFVKILGELFLFATKSSADLTSLKFFIDIIKIVENTSDLIRFTAELLNCYFEQQQTQYLWLLILLAQTKSFAITFDKEKIIIVGSSLLINEKVGKKSKFDVSEFDAQLSVIQKELIEKNLIPKKILGDVVIKPYSQLASAEMYGSNVSESYCNFFPVARKFSLSEQLVPIITEITELSEIERLKRERVFIDPEVAKELEPSDEAKRAKLSCRET